MAIILIGMPSSGKSTLGVLLAKALGYSFTDTDLLIQEHEGRLLHEIIKDEGIDGFIEIENRVNQSVAGGNTVIATGGSAIYGEEAMKHLSSLGKIVYIKIPFDVLEQRLGDYTHRGVAIKSGMTLHDMYLERVPLYEKYADITVDGNGSMHETVQRLVDILKG